MLTDDDYFKAVSHTYDGLTDSLGGFACTCHYKPTVYHTLGRTFYHQPEKTMRLTIKTENCNGPSRADKPHVVCFVVCVLSHRLVCVLSHHLVCVCVSCHVMCVFQCVVTLFSFCVAIVLTDCSYLSVVTYMYICMLLFCVSFVPTVPLSLFVSCVIMYFLSVC